MSKPVEVKVTTGSRLEMLDVFHLLAEEMARLAGLEEGEQFNFALAVREAATNAVIHGNGENPDKSVTVTFGLSPQALNAQIVDEGSGFDFNKRQKVDPRLPENRVRTSGRGLLLIRSFVDEVTYNHIPTGGTEIRLVKRLVG
jgi:serine/threonine-protein kinase RsbW